MHSDTIADVAISPDGKRVATAGMDRVARVFSVDDGTEVGAFEGHGGHVLGVSWRDDGRVLATAGADKQVKLWDLEQVKLMKNVGGFGHEVTAIEFVGLGEDLITSSGDKNVRFGKAQLRRPGEVFSSIRWLRAQMARSWSLAATTGRCACGTARRRRACSVSRRSRRRATIFGADCSGWSAVLRIRWRMSFAWDLVQHYQIEKAREEAQLAHAKSEGQGHRVDYVRDQVERLTLACQAMWELLRDHSDLTEEDLQSKILEIDARDGHVDGKLGHEVLACPHCSQRTSTRRSRCVFCGGQVQSRHTFKS